MRRRFVLLLTVSAAVSCVAGDCTGGTLLVEYGGGGSAGAIADAGAE